MRMSDWSSDVCSSDLSGSDILRVWVASTDYFDDVRIGKEVLAGSSDAYRKLRNSFRYLLGALSDFSEEEKLPVAEMPELERYMLHLQIGRESFRERVCQ